MRYSTRILKCPVVSGKRPCPQYFVGTNPEPAEDSASEMNPATGCEDEVVALVGVIANRCEYNDHRQNECCYE